MNEKQKKELSDKLKYILSGQKVSELAKESGVSRSYLSQYLSESRETTPTPDILKKIAKASNGAASYKELMMIVGYVDEDFIKTDEEEGNWFSFLNSSGKLKKTKKNYTDLLGNVLKHKEMVPLYKFEEELIWDRANNKGRKYNYTSKENRYFSTDLAEKATYAVEVNNNKLKEIGFIKGDVLLIKMLEDELPASGSTVLTIIKHENGVERSVKKYFRLDNGRVHLDPSDNSKTIYDESEIKIIGKVIAMRRDLEV
jgi:transcriptional regulator with XRE-family HTH domain